MLRKKVSSDAVALGFFGNGFDAVFAVFTEAGAVIVGVGPGATGAVDAALLVEGKHSFFRVTYPHVFAGVIEGRTHPLQSSGLGLCFALAHARKGFRRLRSSIFGRSDYDDFVSFAFNSGGINDIRFWLLATALFGFFLHVPNGDETPNLSEWEHCAQN